jgi:cyclase
MGGGIKSAEDAAFLILHGADKVVLNSLAYTQPDVIAATAKSFGTQSMIVCIDALLDDDGKSYRLMADCGRRPVSVSLEDHVKRCTDAGAGEIMVQSIDRDGTMSGFDIRLIEAAMSATNLPVIGAGGSGNYEHLKDAFLATDVSALACGSLFNFSDSNPVRAKAFLANYGLNFKTD